MLISYKWLKDYVRLPDSVTPEDVAEKLKMSVVEVEKVERQEKSLENIVVGKVLKVEKHPNADKLKVCVVDVGEKKLKIVCGGSNVREKMLVALAKAGARVRWHGAGEPVELQPAAIRGVDSQGMICSATEIGLEEMFPLREEKEIIDLTGVKAQVGRPLSVALGLDDAVLEVDNKSLSHRPDLWGHYGIAREVAALYRKEFGGYTPPKISARGGGKKISLRVEVKDPHTKDFGVRTGKKLCPRYMAAAIEGVDIKSSPGWLKKRLLAAGVRPINNVVDITNYVMLDLGQPMHAFDAARFKEKKIVVRPAKEGEKFTTLDGTEHKLYSSMLVIADEKEPVAIAGVMGGLNSGVTDSTSTIIFESANFDAGSIRKTAGKLGLRTESSARFEKSLDPNLAELALRRAVQLTLELCPASRVASNIADAADFKSKRGPIELPLAFAAKRLGVELNKKETIKILERLGFVVKTKKDVLSVLAPTWRATKDISSAEDLVEEVARFYGFNNIPPSLPAFSVAPSEANRLRVLERKAGETLVRELGYSEVYNYSFVSEAQIKNLGDDMAKYIELDNPLSKEKPYLRRNLLPNLLDNLAANLERYSSVKIFETGQVFMSEESGPRAAKNSSQLLPHQDTWLTAVCVDKKTNAGYWEARRALEVVFASLGRQFELAKIDKVLPWEHPTRLSLFSHGGAMVGVVCELNPSVGANYGLDKRVGVLRINLTKLSEKIFRSKSAYAPVPVYPESERDIAFTVKKETAHGEILDALKGADVLLKKVELFDVYEGNELAADSKSMAYHLTYGDAEKTLTSAEVDAACEKARKILEEKFGAKMR
ncbi:phenylalanine--tRNA ligase subunit beta [Patescibacteria group bacterium]|nr:MAG: phenylalanine--tRNA ligase subunit beta [Patescibacteria group bacterium]